MSSDSDKLFLSTQTKLPRTAKWKNEKFNDDRSENSPELLTKMGNWVRERFRGSKKKGLRSNISLGVRMDDDALGRKLAQSLRTFHQLVEGR